MAAVTAEARSAPSASSDSEDGPDMDVTAIRVLRTKAVVRATVVSKTTCES